MFSSIQGLSSNGCKVGLNKRQREDHSDQHPKQDIRAALEDLQAMEEVQIIKWNQPRHKRYKEME